MFNRKGFRWGLGELEMIHPSQGILGKELQQEDMKSHT